MIDHVMASIHEERRSDIVYGWNNDATGLQLVFEFKKMSRSASDREHYLERKGWNVLSLGTIAVISRCRYGEYSRARRVCARSCHYSHSGVCSLRGRTR